MRILASVLIAATAFSQPASEPEIRGTVQEYRSNAPVAAAEVVLKEFILVDNVVTPAVIATTVTNSRGEFSFKPGHAGNFYIETNKTGYQDATLRNGGTASAEAALDLTREPNAAIKLVLMRPGEIVGRVVDASGEPIPELRIAMESPGQITRAFGTDAKGEFRVSVAPGPYVLQTVSRTGIDLVPRERPQAEVFRPTLDYTEEAFKIVDEQYESLYWPGGTPNQDSALPMEVAPGASANFGTLTVRKVAKYRAHVTIDGECMPGESWAFTVVPQARSSDLPFLVVLGCPKDILLTGLQPGNHLLAVWSRQQWAQVPLTVTDHNIKAALTMSPGARIEGRLIAPEGVALASLGQVRISSYATQQALGMGGSPIAEPDASGRFVFDDVLWLEHTISVELLQNPNVYVKEIRYGGIPLSGSTFHIAKGSALEVMLDANAASVSGVVTDSSKPVPAGILIARWPLSGPLVGGARRATSNDGTFTIGSLAPGEYRLIAIEQDKMSRTTSIPLDRLFANGLSIRLERGEQKTIEVKLTDPSR